MGEPKHVVIEKQHLSGEKLKDAVGFVPEISFEEGLENTILFYRDYFNGKSDRNIENDLPQVANLTV